MKSPDPAYSPRLSRREASREPEADRFVEYRRALSRWENEGGALAGSEIAHLSAAQAEPWQTTYHNP
jgi:hypothetical protein